MFPNDSRRGLECLRRYYPPLHTHSGICFACGGASVCPKQPPWPGRNAPEQLPCRPVYAFPVLIHPSIPSTFTPSIIHSLLLPFCFLLLVLSHQAVFLLTRILVIFRLLTKFAYVRGESNSAVDGEACEESENIEHAKEHTCQQMPNKNSKIKG